MTGYTRSPRLIKGAIIAIQAPNPVPTVIAFRLNPETMSRTLETRSAEGEGGQETFRLAGAPKESIKVDCVFDATDDLEVGDEAVVANGLHPRLAALEMLIYPQTATVIANSVLMALGAVEILSAKGPFTIFCWGSKRILPVKLSGMTIAEEAFDPNLNPIRAKVSLDMQVLSYSDLEITHPGYALFLSHQIVKETMAAIGKVEGLGSVLGGDVKLF